jgi:hypothetical protein
VLRLSIPTQRRGRTTAHGVRLDSTGHRKGKKETLDHVGKDFSSDPRPSSITAHDNSYAIDTSRAPWDPSRPRSPRLIIRPNGKTDKSEKRIQYNRRFVNVTLTPGGKRKVYV